jgi:branched-chain amino acid aminotransferase
MITTGNMRITKTKNSRISEVDFNKLDFGTMISDHMLLSDFSNNSWHEPEIVPFGNLSFSPTMLALHYGQVVFEGMKAFKMKDGNISIFRVDKHYERFCRSLERMCMPSVPFEIFREGLVTLIKTDADWVPATDGAALYIRPFVFASEERFGVKVAEEYKYIVFTGPVGPYYAQPLKVKVEESYRRAARGGTGFAKCAGNYGGAFYPLSLARKAGFDQVLWTDGSADLNIEESGTMNVLFVIDNAIITPPLSDSILDGVTRDSILTLAKGLGYKVEERKIGAKELLSAFQKGAFQEAFGAGTAAVVAPIQTINIKGNDYQLPELKPNNVASTIKKQLLDIRLGVAPDRYHWNTIVKL